MATATGPVPKFLMAISQNWNLTPNFDKVWAVQFRPSAYEINCSQTKTLEERFEKIFEVYGSLDRHRLKVIGDESNIYKNLLNLDVNDSLNIDVSGVQHFILANKLSVPAVSYNVEFGGHDPANYTGGYMAAPIGKAFTMNRELNISFLDTYCEFNDYVIIPWLWALGHRGLVIADEGSLPNLKCDIYAYFFAKSSPKATTTDETLELSSFQPYYYGEAGGTQPETAESNIYYWERKTTQYQVKTLNENQPYLRKAIIFRNCVPVSNGQKDYNYDNQGGQALVTSVGFKFEYFETIVGSALKGDSDTSCKLGGAGKTYVKL